MLPTDGTIDAPDTLQQKLELPLLPDTDFEHQPAIGTEVVERVAQDRLVDGEAVGSTVESLAGFTGQERGFVPGKTTGGDVRRVTDHHVNQALEARAFERDE